MYWNTAIMNESISPESAKYHNCYYYGDQSRSLDDIIADGTQGSGQGVCSMMRIDTGPSTLFKDPSSTMHRNDDDRPEIEGGCLLL